MRVRGMRVRSHCWCPLGRRDVDRRGADIRKGIGDASANSCERGGHRVTGAPTTIRSDDYRCALALHAKRTAFPMITLDALIWIRGAPSWSRVSWSWLHLRKAKGGRRSSFRPATTERRNRHSRRRFGLQRLSAPRPTQLTASSPFLLTTAHPPYASAR